MKKFFVMFAIATALVACNDSATSTEKKADSSATPAATVDSNTTTPAAATIDSNKTATPAGDSIKPATADSTKK